MPHWQGMSVALLPSFIDKDIDTERFRGLPKVTQPVGGVGEPPEPEPIWAKAQALHYPTMLFLGSSVFYEKITNTELLTDQQHLLGSQQALWHPQHKQTSGWMFKGFSEVPCPNLEYYIWASVQTSWEETLVESKTPSTCLKALFQSMPPSSSILLVVRLPLTELFLCARHTDYFTI